MPVRPVRCSSPFAVCATLLVVAVAAAQPPATTPGAPPASPAVAPTPPATPPAPPGARLTQSVRNKLSAADLPSAESLVEVYGRTQGEDGFHLLGTSWLARGALLLGDEERAWHWVRETRKRTDARLARGVSPAKDDSLEIALGAAIEVEAQLRQRDKGAKDALRFLDAEAAKVTEPVALRSRIAKRRNLIDLVGKPAPEIRVEAAAGATAGAPATLASHRGKPVLLYLWDKGCGDCRAQAATLSKVVAKYEAKGLVLVPLTRYYGGEEPERAHARLDSTWAADYALLGARPLAISTEAMVRYGGSSTPTFVFVDRKGVVRSYLPYRLTEEAFDREIAKIL